MALPLKHSYPPMEAKSVAQLPSGEVWQYEPKWDGFRCLAFRDGDEVALQSKSGQPLARYFPELVDALLQLKAKQFVLDGEIVVPIKGRLSFDDLLMRIHPAASRIKKLALTKQLEKLIKPPGFTGNAPGGPSRWATERSAEWQPLAPKLVIEVQYDHFTGGRFRHGTKLLRWRPDKEPAQCLMDQVSQNRLR